jgi:hypothetical protein
LVTTRDDKCPEGYTEVTVTRQDKSAKEFAQAHRISALEAQVTDLSVISQERYIRISALEAQVESHPLLWAGEVSYE